MLAIKIPSTFIPERNYVIRQLLGELLGLSYSVHIHETNLSMDYIIIALPNGRSLWIRDVFFSQFKDGEVYWHTDVSKIEVKHWHHDAAPEESLPVLFGEAVLRADEGDLVCEADLLAGVFFMLTRWEELASPERDTHGRFPLKNSLAYKYQYWKRPVVNETVEMLWNLLQLLGIEQERKAVAFEMVITHDVDDLAYWGRKFRLLRSLGRTCLQMQPVEAYRVLQNYVRVKRGQEQDPYLTFDWLMDISERIGVQSRFYFMSGGISEYDNRYAIKSKACQRLLKHIQHRGHKLGFHPSYHSFTNKEQFIAEKLRLEEVAQCEIDEGRQHYLRFNADQTWRIWEEAGMKLDSTLGFAEDGGFRSGICQAYQVFDVRNRCELTLREMPLTVMEVSLVGYLGLSPQDMLDRMNELQQKVRRYGGQFVLLWHNSNLSGRTWDPYRPIYQSFLLEGDVKSEQRRSSVIRASRTLG
ncbi:polysaccharide deacetylase family protein [Paenibacillus terrigena]|uniref:polysaccharide deacetylase family protein n=1 Tax=Paenibacillus terrigena TaxID=369333 RepID=UPI0028D8AB00|nr:polysaccharide deacetylase family protein [Paenibacillus terrigena]